MLFLGACTCAAVPSKARELAAGLICLVLSFACTAALAGDFPIGTIGGLYEACRQVRGAEEGGKHDERGYGLCLGYMRGVKDSYEIRKLAGAKGNICVPDNATWLQLIHVFLHWADSNPQRMHMLAWTGVVESWSRAFPCPANEGG